MKYVKSEDIAREVCHDIFAKLWENKETLSTEKNLKSYLFTSVKNRSLNYLRDHKKFSDETPEFYESETEDNNDMELAELQTRIADAMAKLPEKCREIFVLSREEGLKYQEIADKLNISVKTVENQMGKALKIMREELQDYLTLLVLFIYYGVK